MILAKHKEHVNAEYALTGSPNGIIYEMRLQLTIESLILIETFYEKHFNLYFYRNYFKHIQNENLFE